MSLEIPYRLANGVGNKPDALKWNANDDFLTAMLFGNFISNGGFETWLAATSFSNPANAAAVATNWTWAKSGSSAPTVDVSREATIIQEGTYAGKINITGAGSSDSLCGFYQAVVDPTRLRGETVIFGARVRTSTASKVRLKIVDGTSTSYSSYHSGSGTFELLQVALALSASLSAITVTIEVTSDFTGAIYTDGVYLYVIPPNMTAIARAFLTYSPFLQPAFPVSGGTMAGAVDMNGNNINMTAGDIAMGGGDMTGLVSLNGGQLSGLRNRIINGDMRIDQRNAGASLSVNGTTLYSADRWHVAEATGGALTSQRLSATPPTGFTHYLRLTCTTADASIGAAEIAYVGQGIEGSFVSDLLFGSASAKSISISFWVRSSLTGTYTGFLRNAANNRGYPFTYSISVADTWEYKTVTLTGDLTGTWTTDNTRGLHLGFILAAGSDFQFTANTWAAGSALSTSSQVNFMSSNSSRTWDITGVQLEIGSQASAFEYRPEGLEHILCQRYYEKSYVISTAIASVVSDVNRNRMIGAKIGGNITSTGCIMYKVEKRVNPTVTLWAEDGTSGSWSWVLPGTSTTVRVTTVIGAGTKSFSVQQSVNETEWQCYGQWGSDAEL